VNTRIEHGNTTAGTRERILLAAQRIFAEQGFDAATLRDITEAAGTNVASVNYHFRSKDELIRQTLDAALAPVNAARLAALDAARDQAGNNPLPVEAIVQALVRPMVELSRDADGGRPLIRLLLQARALPRPETSEVIASQFDPVHERFVDALEETLPGVTRALIVWRYDFARGAMMQILTDLDPSIRRLSGLDSEASPVDDEAIVSHLVAFISAGLSAEEA
jgi:AcrR family transcriptional regulator